jgi:septum formation protein
VRLVLASSSPRRAELLRAAGFTFEVQPQEVDERLLPGEEPAEHVVRLAREKASRAGRARPDAVVLGADTVVVVDGFVLGKPGDDRDAAAMLRRLSGRTHSVLTGIAICADSSLSEATARTEVQFVRLGDEEIAWYVSTGEPRDKAGAYAIQGLASRFVERIDGSYSNVVGLPVALVARMLKAWGLC